MLVGVEPTKIVIFLKTNFVFEGVWRGSKNVTMASSFNDGYLCVRYSKSVSTNSPVL